jgi:hypothetical protein
VYTSYKLETEKGRGKASRKRRGRKRQGKRKKKKEEIFLRAERIKAERSTFIHF